MTIREKKPPRAGMGRPKGAKNKSTKAIKDMILGALSDAGGQAYLLRQAEENPTAFLQLVGKILPHELNVGGQSGNPIVSKIEIEFIDS